MGYLIFSALADAQAYTAEIERVQGIPRPGTDRWGDPLKHSTQELWAVIEPNGYIVEKPASAIEDLDVLPDGWFPVEPL